MRIRGLIAAAGSSSRMDGFKPLMELNGFPMIQMTVQSFKNAGIKDITVVTGFRHKEMEPVLRALDVEIVENTAYLETDMFASVRLGLSRMLENETDAVFFLPGDIPLVSPKSMEKMKEGIRKADRHTQVLLPVAKGTAAHPPVILKKGLKPVLCFEGDGGLRGAFASMAAEGIDLNLDEGALADADYRADFEALAAYARVYKGVSERIWEALYEEAGIPESLRKHNRMVGALAGRMAERLTETGICLDVELCRSGGCLHDLGPLSGSILKERGYLALAELAGEKSIAGKENFSIREEWAVVRLADRTLHGETAVKSDKICQRLLKEFEVTTGERLQRILYLYE